MLGLANWHHEGVGPSLQLSPAAQLDLFGALDQPIEELPQFLLDLRLGPETGICCDVLSRPVPDRLVPVEVRAIRRQLDKQEIRACVKSCGNTLPGLRLFSLRLSASGNSRRAGGCRP